MATFGIGCRYRYRISKKGGFPRTSTPIPIAIPTLTIEQSTSVPEPIQKW
jgi:hypothetical protein